MIGSVPSCPRTLLVADRSTPSVEHGWTVRARQVVLAAGAIEQPPLFPHNDRPGILLSGAMRAYLERVDVRPANAMAVFTNNDSAYQAAFALARASVDVPAIVDGRPDVSKTLRDTADNLRIPVIADSTVVSTRWCRRITGIAIAQCGESRPTRKLAYDSRLAAFIPVECSRALAIAGAADVRLPSTPLSRTALARPPRS